MLCVDIKVNKNEIGRLKIKNLGIKKSNMRGLVGTERLYKYSCKMKQGKNFRYGGIEGEMSHDREDGVLILIKKVIEDIEKREILDVLLNII